MSSILPGLLINFISTPEADSFNDISLVDKDGDKHSVSKIIMAAHSNVLFKIFTQEQSNTILHLPTVSGLSLVLILRWIESEELELNWTSVVDVLETAEFLDIPSVSNLCQEWLVNRMDPNNVLGIWRFAKVHFLMTLERSSWRIITEQFSLIYKTEEFLQLPSEILRIILISDELSCGEEEMWEGLLVWLGNKQELEEVNTLMETVRFGLLEPDFYMRRVKTNPLFQDIAPKVDEVIKYIKSSLFVENITSLRCNSNYWTRPRFPQALLFIFGGFSSQGPVSTISVYDPAADRWRDLATTLPDKWAFMDTVLLGTDVYMCGGYIEMAGELATRVLIKFCLNTMKVTRLSIMRESRSFLSLAVHNGSIYAIGGIKGDLRLSSVECLTSALTSGSR